MLRNLLSKGLGLWLLTLVPIAVVTLGVGASVGQEPFDYARRKTSISLDIRNSLAPAKLGLRVLERANSDEEILRAVGAIWDSYKHLRSAQEHSEALQGSMKFADPLIPLRNARILWIRDRLRFCRDNEAHLIKRTPDVTAQCLAGLGDAVRRLEILVVTEQ